MQGATGKNSLTVLNSLNLTVRIVRPVEAYYICMAGFMFYLKSTKILLVNDV